MRDKRAVGAATLVALVALVAVGCASWQAAETADADADGVVDGADECVGTPAGVAVDAAGCPRYTDADEVPDYLDRCPATPSGVRVDVNGCPLDSDGDRVSDYLDECPDTVPGADVDREGCRIPTPPTSIVTNLNFDSDSARIRDDAKAKLRRVIAIVEETPDADIRIVGHTDDRGPAAYNVGLSLRRAESVKDYMISRGVDRARLSVLGKGESEPLVPNTTSEGRAVNRRVEFEVLPK